MTLKRNIHGNKILLCIWDIKGVVYYELLTETESKLLLSVQQQFINNN